MPDALLFGLIGGTVGLLAGGAIVALRMSPRVTHLAAERARLEAELRAAETQTALLVQSQTQLREAFAALSHDALLENRKDFLRNADTLLAPVRDSLNRVQNQLVTVDKEREGSYRAVAAQLTQLSGAQRELRDAAEGLSRSLRSPNARGKWGEIQLRRVVELAGMVSYCDFDIKPSSASADGSRLAPDLVVNLPGEGAIVVDAKVPIDGYLTATEAKTEAERAASLAAHLRQVKEHIRTLAKKEYWKLYPNSPQFVVMFVPLEPLLSAALEQDQALLEQAAGLNVIPATPLTLLALLKTVALGWRQDQVAKNAEEIQLAGRDLYDRLRTMVGHIEAVGRNIKQAGDSYDRFIGSLEQRVLPGARKLTDLGVQSAEDIGSPETLMLSVRPLTRPELVSVEGQPAETAGDAPLFDEVMLRQPRRTSED
jgi:DNA recombination protein RmuC